MIAWVREHGSEYGADTTTIFLAGNSACAHLTAMAALTQNSPTFQPGFESVDTSVIAAICLYGYYGYIDTNPGLISSPMDYSGKLAPPFFVAHGNQDRLVPVENA